MIRTRSATIVLGLAVLVASAAAAAQAPPSGVSFTVSMQRPEAHYLRVVLRCDGLAGATHDFEMPAWTPGYYKIMDYARNVVDFRAADGAGAPLTSEKIAKGTWRVAARGASSVTVSYRVFAFDSSVADSYLDDGHAYISPTGVFMYVDGNLRRPVTVTVEPGNGWTAISTGLDPVEGRPATFRASDYDVLYDCPILVGNQEIRRFEVRGVPHTVALDTFGTYDRTKLTDDVRRIVEAAVTFIGEIPYRHYDFIAMSPGVGGLEHQNSTVLICDASTLNNAAGYRDWLAFVAHEYFHLYNVKRIRPIALGPFDYQRENYTRMLWASEGFTVYYEDRILRRAGLITADEYLDKVTRYITRYENVPGHLVQSATDSSFDTWIQFFARSENAADTTISYYDKGAALGVLLDLAIRNATENRRSLDDVMRALYQEFYKEKQRGFTDQEFRDVCERTAGAPLGDIFEYASTVKAVDYPRYFGYAGLDVEVQPRPQPGAWLGASTVEKDGKLVVVSVEGNSPAARAGLSARDEVIALDGARASAETLFQALAARQPGQAIRVLVSRRTGIRELEVVLGTRSERSFRLTRKANPTPLQSAILAEWLKEAPDPAVAAAKP